MINSYIGHNSQIYGVEESRLVGGKGDGMRLFHVKNGKGLEFTVSADRCADISRLSYRGYNYGYFSPNGYVAPAYYDDKGNGFLKSFTAGFLTTCGLTAVGSSCIDQGKELPLHGTVSNCPAEHIYYTIDEEWIIIHALIGQRQVLSDKLILNREIKTSLRNNKVIIVDNIENVGDKETPLMILYHFNMGYPLLNEHAILNIPSKKVLARNEYAAKDIDLWDKISKPKSGIDEQCYYHEFEEEGSAALFNPIINKGIAITFDSKNLNYFTEWKMMGIKDYVLGLEPGNCHPDGRLKMRQDGKLIFLQPGEKKTYEVLLTIIEDLPQWNAL